MFTKFYIFVRIVDNFLITGTESHNILIIIKEIYKLGNRKNFIINIVKCTQHDNITRN